MKLFVGIDVSSEKLDVCFLTDDDQLSILSEKILFGLNNSVACLMRIRPTETMH